MVHRRDRRDVHIYDVGGPADVGSVPLASTDPARSLIDKGLPEPLVIELLGVG